MSLSFLSCIVGRCSVIIGGWLHSGHVRWPTVTHTFAFSQIPFLLGIHYPEKLPLWNPAFLFKLCEHCSLCVKESRHLENIFLELSFYRKNSLQNTLYFTLILNPLFNYKEIMAITFQFTRDKNQKKTFENPKERRKWVMDDINLKIKCLNSKGSEDTGKNK